MNTEELALKYKFISSPTIRINQLDIEADVAEDNCKSCGELCGDSINCRTFTYQNIQYHEPPVEMIIDNDNTLKDWRILEEVLVYWKYD